MIFLYGVPMFVSCCAILWIYLNRPKKPPKPRGHRKKKIFISGDVLLAVFEFLAPSQLGLGIALVSHRFDIIVDEQFKTRNWALKSMEICRQFWKFFTKEMEIVDYYWKILPIPQVQLPRNVIGFKCITISFIDQNAIAFLHRLRPLFAASPIYLSIETISGNYRIWKLILRDIWPMFGNNIHSMGLSAGCFHRLRKFVPSFLDDCASLRVVSLDNFFIEFPADDSATASDGQFVAKWLFTPRPNNVPKVFECSLYMDDEMLLSMIDAIKGAFVWATSPANFIFAIWVLTYEDTVMPFVLTNELTREQLALKGTNSRRCFLLIRCPIARDASKWAKWEKEASGWRIHDQWNQIDISIICTGAIGDGLLDATPGPSDQQQK